MATANRYVQQTKKQERRNCRAASHWEPGFFLEVFFFGFLGRGQSTENRSLDLNVGLKFSFHGAWLFFFFFFLRVK